MKAEEIEEILAELSDRVGKLVTAAEASVRAIEAHRDAIVLLGKKVSKLEETVYGRNSK